MRSVVVSDVPVMDIFFNMSPVILTLDKPQPVETILCTQKQKIILALKCNHRYICCAQNVKKAWNLRGRKRKPRFINKIERCRLTPHIILPTKTTASENEAALSYHRLRGIYFLAIVFVRSIYT